MEVTRLKQLRNERHVSQKALAKAMKVSPSTVGMWEQGRNEPSHEMLKFMADYFGVTTDYLLGRNSGSCSLTKLQKALLDGFNTLNSEGQNLIMGVLSSLKMSHAKQANSSGIVQKNSGGNNFLATGGNNNYSIVTP